VFHIFNWIFISFIQSILVFLLSAPVYSLLLAAQFEPEITTSDIAYIAVELGLIVIEAVADQQQWGNLELRTLTRTMTNMQSDFQTAKKQYLKTAKVPRGFNQADLDRGFITSGLWGYSRHPNFAAEQSIWFFFYQWACFATNSLYSWAAIGPSFLVLLFQGSTWLTESITSRKYTDYRDYQSKVGMFVPTGFSGYKPPSVKAPKIIRTSELAKKQI
jgi:steroid 5-alpha reductase family enzyme